MRLKTSSAKRRKFYLGKDELITMMMHLHVSGHAITMHTGNNGDYSHFWFKVLDINTRLLLEYFSFKCLKKMKWCCAL